MNILYVAPDIPVPHTGDFVGGPTHVLKIAESLAKGGNNWRIFLRGEFIKNSPRSCCVALIEGDIDLCSIQQNNIYVVGTRLESCQPQR